MAAHKKPPFREAFTQVWREPAARQFTIFIFVSMLAYSMQELLVEPFAGVVFGMTPGTTTKLAGLQHGGVLLGMIGVALAATVIGGPRLGSLRLWTVGGCIASGVSLVAVAASGYAGLALALRASVFALGVSNGAFAVAAIGSMMGLAGAGANAREGTRMGLWGAAQAIAFGCGGVFATILVDIAKFDRRRATGGLRHRLHRRGGALRRLRRAREPHRQPADRARFRLDRRRMPQRRNHNGGARDDR